MNFIFNNEGKMSNYKKRHSKNGYQKKLMMKIVTCAVVFQVFVLGSSHLYAEGGGTGSGGTFGHDRFDLSWCPKSHSKLQEAKIASDYLNGSMEYHNAFNKLRIGVKEALKSSLVAGNSLEKNALTYSDEVMNVLASYIGQETINILDVVAHAQGLYSILLLDFVPAQIPVPQSYDSFALITKFKLLILDYASTYYSKQNDIFIPKAADTNITLNVLKLTAEAILESKRYDLYKARNQCQYIEIHQFIVDILSFINGNHPYMQNTKLPTNMSQNTTVQCSSTD